MKGFVMSSEVETSLDYSNRNTTRFGRNDNSAALRSK